MSDEPEKPVSPAVHTDALWDRDSLPGGVLTNVDLEPIEAKDMTKSEYFALLSARGLRMKNQQESTIGPEPDFEAMAAAEAAALALTHEIVPPRPFTKRDADIFQAHEAVLLRYGLLETLGCDVCWQANRPSGCRTVVDHHRVRVECRCGVREYQPPAGTTDGTYAFGRPIENDRAQSTVLDANGIPTSLPAVILSSLDAEIIRAYMRLLHVRRLSRSLFCRLCSLGRYTDETAIREAVTDDNVVYVCACRLRYAKA